MHTPPPFLFDDAVPAGREREAGVKVKRSTKWPRRAANGPKGRASVGPYEGPTVAGLLSDDMMKTR